MSEIIANAKNASNDALLNLRVDRNAELAALKASAAVNGRNVIIYGSRGCGKTFLLRILAHELSLSPGILPVYLCATSTWLDRAPEEIANNILMNLCSAIWREIFERPYSELLSRSTGESEGVLDSFKPGIEQFVRIYKQLTAVQFEYRANTTKSIGAAAIAKAEIKSDSGSTIRRVGLMPFEFQALFDEIRNISFGKRDIFPVIICDEINSIDVSAQELLFESCLDIFSTSGVRFIAAAGHLRWERIDFFPRVFERSMEICGMPDAHHTGELVRKHFDSSGHKFLSDAIEIVFSFFSGHPRETIHACEIAIQRANNVPIDMKIMLDACLEVQKMLKDMENIHKNNK